MPIHATILTTYIVSNSDQWVTLGTDHKDSTQTPDLRNYDAIYPELSNVHSLTPPYNHPTHRHIYNPSWGEPQGSSRSYS
jgi:hypothetical protein